MLLLLLSDNDDLRSRLDKEAADRARETQDLRDRLDKECGALKEKLDKEIADRKVELQKFYLTQLFRLTGTICRNKSQTMPPMVTLLRMNSGR